MEIENLIYETIGGRFAVIATDEQDQIDGYFNSKEEAIDFIKEKYSEQF